VVNAIFNTNCVAGCTVTGNGGPMCSCTASTFYWSSTTERYYPGLAWFVYFFNGLVTEAAKSDPDAVRAERGGL
jgi:hypothetical protein